jgi:hypothetical protein
MWKESLQYVSECDFEVNFSRWSFYHTPRDDTCMVYHSLNGSTANERFRDFLNALWGSLIVENFSHKYHTEMVFRLFFKQIKTFEIPKKNKFYQNESLNAESNLKTSKTFSHNHHTSICKASTPFHHLNSFRVVVLTDTLNLSIRYLRTQI